MIAVVFFKTAIHHKVEKAAKDKRDDAAEHDINAARQRGNKQQQRIENKQDTVWDSLSLFPFRSEQKNEEKRNQNFQYILGTVKKHHIEIFQHSG